MAEIAKLLGLWRLIIILAFAVRLLEVIKSRNREEAKASLSRLARENRGQPFPGAFAFVLTSLFFSLIGGILVALVSAAKGFGPGI